MVTAAFSNNKKGNSSPQHKSIKLKKLSQEPIKFNGLLVQHMSWLRC